MVSPLPGMGLKVNVPPGVPVTVAAGDADPAQKFVVVKLASSKGLTVTVDDPVFEQPVAVIVPVTV